MINVIKCFGDIMGGCVQFLKDFAPFDSISLWNIMLGLLVLDFGISLIHFILSNEEGRKK